MISLSRERHKPLTFASKLLSYWYSSSNFKNDTSSRNTAVKVSFGNIQTCSTLTELPRTRKFLFLYPYESHFPVKRRASNSKSITNFLQRTLIQTGISGKTRIHTLDPFKTFNFLLIVSSAEVICLALKRTPFPLILIPHSPNLSVVPRVEPPVGMGTRPLCLLMNLTCLGAS